MLLVKTYLDKSPIDGIGLFAREDIEIGEKISEYDAWFNPLIRKSSYNSITKDFLRKYGVFEKVHIGYRLYLDDERFMNHSDDPNTIQEDVNTCIAKVNIKKGEEITCNYKELEK